jgi:hypothetical protein
LPNRWTWLCLLGVALNGCSDATTPTAGMFHAQLTGVRIAGLSGSAIAERNFTEAFPDLHFVIRMDASRSDTVQTIGIRCLGDHPPALGSHTIDLAGATCVATYSRALTTSEPGTVGLERAEAVTGTLTIEASPAGQTAGSFTFRGTLRVDSDSVGILTASGSFSADPLSPPNFMGAARGSRRTRLPPFS